MIIITNNNIKNNVLYKEIEDIEHEKTKVKIIYTTYYYITYDKNQINNDTINIILYSVYNN